MSEYTTIYLRRKEIPLLKYKEHPSYEECQKLPKEHDSKPRVDDASMESFFEYTNQRPA